MSINQKEYLKKYLSLGSDGSKKKKRKKKTISTTNRVRIIDDDIDVNLFSQAVEEDMYGANEDAPQIVGVIDERPLELRIDDYRKSNLWKPVGSTSGDILIKTEINHEGNEKKDDLSPVRVKMEVDSDCSPPRRNRDSEDLSPRREKRKKEHKIKSESKKIVFDKKSGLQTSKEAVKELEELKKNEEESFKKMSKEISGVSAKTVYRDRKTGKVRDFEKEAEIEKEKKEKEEERTEKYTRWGRGLKQVEDYTKKLNEDLHEMNKPLARYADDEDLEKYLKEQERAGDPMLGYLRKKKKKEQIETSKSLKPQYEGEFMPNRYGIRPGHRWDGVDRSNGYEIKWIQRINAQSAQEEDVYKWSTEDM